jgi:hypothetical protein
MYENKPKIPRPIKQVLLVSGRKYSINVVKSIKSIKMKKWLRFYKKRNCYIFEQVEKNNYLHIILTK